MSSHVIDNTGQFVMVPFEIVEKLQDAKALALYVILKKFANHRTKQSYPSRKTLAALMGYESTIQVDRAVKTLEEVGVLTTFPRYRNVDTGEISTTPGDGFSQTSNGYVLHDLPQEPPISIDAPPISRDDTPYIYRCTPPISRDDTPPISIDAPPLYPGMTRTISSELEPAELEPVNYSPPNPPEGGSDHELSLMPAENLAPEKKPATSEKTAKPISRQTGCRLPDGWTPQHTTVEKITSQFPHLTREELLAEHECFTDYWVAQPGAKGRKVDWEATWRNWMRRYAQNRPKNTASRVPGAGLTGLDARAAQWAEMAARVKARRGNELR